MLLDNEDEEVNEDNYKKWQPSNGWMLNPGGVRHPTFDKHCLYGSPGVTGENPWHLTKLDAREPWSPIDWKYLANVCPSDLVMGGCFPNKCNANLSP